MVQGRCAGAWMIAQRDIVHNGSAIGRALDYSLKRWAALSRYLDDGAVPIDNNLVREPDTALGAGAQELALCRLTAQRQTRRRDHEFDPVGSQQRARSVCLTKRRAGTPTDAAGQ